MTRQVSRGTISGHDITVTITGPEAQDLNDGVGSDVLMVRVEERLSGLKADVEGEPRGQR